MPTPAPRASDPAALRTLALVGASAAGKTTLVEALLLKAGVIGAPGSVDKGSTVSDFDPLERQFQHSLNTSLVHLHHRDTRVHLIDTPGYPDFIGPALTALEAVETAAVVLDAARGIEPAMRRFISSESVSCAAVICWKMRSTNGLIAASSAGTRSGCHFFTCAKYALRTASAPASRGISSMSKYDW